MNSLLDNIGAVNAVKSDYSAKDIIVLEGLDPVRTRPGMYVGGVDADAYHHLAAEIIDNAMDEAVAGFASAIEIELFENGFLSVRDNGRGIPVDPHPKYPDKSALEVILTTLHSGGKFAGKAYSVAGGLHGVGMAVVNALSEDLAVEVYRDKKAYRQIFAKGAAMSPMTVAGVSKARGTKVTFKPDPTIFKDIDGFDQDRLYELARSKAFLSKGVEIAFKSPSHDETFKYPNGLADFLSYCTAGKETVTEKPFVMRADFPDDMGHVELAAAWVSEAGGFLSSFCNTIATKDGGTHEAGLKSAFLKGFKTYADMTAKKGPDINSDDILSGAFVLLSVFIKDPQFQGQTKNRLNSAEAAKLVENAVKNQLDHFLTSDPASANEILKSIYEKAEDRLSRKKMSETARASATKRLRLPGKLTDCSRTEKEGTEIFLVEGDSAGGSAKQARKRETQAILPLRGKILNVAGEKTDKVMANQEIRNIIEALGAGIDDNYNESTLRYDKVIIMTDADVDGAHIASLLMTFFYFRMRRLIENGHLYIACPPLYRISYKDKTVYAATDAHKDQILNTTFKGRSVSISRFKGLGEMPAEQLKKTTMDPAGRTLMKVAIAAAEEQETFDLISQLMGKNESKFRLEYICSNATFAKEVDI